MYPAYSENMYETKQAMYNSADNNDYQTLFFFFELRSI